MPEMTPAQKAAANLRRIRARNEAAREAERKGNEARSDKLEANFAPKSAEGKTLDEILATPINP